MEYIKVFDPLAHESRRATRCHLDDRQPGPDRENSGGITGCLALAESLIRPGQDVSPPSTPSPHALRDQHARMIATVIGA
jgi:hypothetical protein